MEKYIDITKTGTEGLKGLKGLKGINTQSSNPSMDEIIEADKLRRSTIKSSPESINRLFLADAVENIGSKLAELNYGESIYDKALVESLISSPEAFLDYRAGEQQWYSKIGAGLSKGAILTGTTFLDGTLGLIIGAGTAIAEGRWSGLWDNDFSKAMMAINERAEELLPNYYSQYEQNEPWYKNIFTANFLGDKFIKNMGFTVGAFYSGNVASLALKATKIPQLIGGVMGKRALDAAKTYRATRTAEDLQKYITLANRASQAPANITSSVGALISAVNEGRIEALHNSKDWFELNKLKLDDIFKSRLENIENEYNANKGSFVRMGENSFVDPAYLKYQESMENEKRMYEQALEKLSEDRLKMGNADLLMNIPVLTASNIFQFGRLYANGFKTARRANNIVNKGKHAETSLEGAIKTGKKAGLAVEDVAKDFAQYGTKSTKAGAVWSATKSALSESSEEALQSLASNVSGIYYAADVNNFYRSKIDPKATEETISWSKAFALGINETVNDGSTWEEAFIGGLTGAMGMPTFRSIRNSEGKLRSPITLEAGMIGEFKDYKEKMVREQSIADYMNNRMLSPEFLNYYRGLVRHNKYQNDMNTAVENNDPFEFKNAEHALLVSDIAMFDNAGKLEDLNILINSAFDTSDENLKSIVENTTNTLEDGSKVGPFVDKNGNPMYATPEGKQEMIKKLQENHEEMTNTINNYLKIKNELDIKTGQQLSDDQLEELTWMKSQIGNWVERATAMSGEVKSVIGNVIGNLDSHLRFNQQVRDFEGQSHADLTDLYRQTDKNIKAIEGAINILNMVRGQDDSVLAHTLATNPKFVDGLIKEINEVDETILSVDEKAGVTTKLNDIVKLGNASKTYNAKLKEYLENPQKQAEDHARADEQAAQQETEKKSDDLRASLNAAQNLQEFRSIIDAQDDTENRDRVLKELEDEDSEMAKNYRETSQYNNEVRRVLNKSDAEPQVKQDAMKLLQDQFSNSENLEQLANPNSIYINNENAFDEDSEGDVELSATRFQEAQYELQKAMSKINNDNRFKDRFSPEYKKPVNNRHNTIVNRVITESGKTVEGTYTKTKDKNEFIHGKFSGHKIAKFRITPASTGLALDELVGPKDKYQSEDSYNEVIADINDGGLAIDSFVVRPDGSVSIVTDNQITIEGKAAKEIYNQLFNPTIKGDDRDTTGDSGTTTVPPVNSTNIIPTIQSPIGNITKDVVAEENKRINDQTLNPQQLDNKQSGQRPYYRPSIPELHILATKEGDFRQFSDVVAEKEGKDFSEIYNYLKDAGAFEYVNKGNLNVGDELKFMIDPEFENKVANQPWHTQPTIFIVHGKNNQIVGSLDESEYSVSRYEGLERLQKRIKDEYANRKDVAGKFIAMPTTRVSQIMVGKVPYGTEERSLKDIPNVNTEGENAAVFGIIKNGVLSTNGLIDDSKIIKPMDMSQKEGRMYLLIPNARGMYSPAAVRVKHFNNVEFNLDDVNVASTAMAKNIQSGITKLAESTNPEDLSEAMKLVNRDLYTGNLHIDWFNSSNGNGIRFTKVERDARGNEIYEGTTPDGKPKRKEVVKLVYLTKKWDPNTLYRIAGDSEVQTGPNIKDTSEVIKEITSILQDFNLPIQINLGMLNKTGYNKMIINSNIITSNIIDASVKSSWFTTDYFDNEGNLHKAISPASIAPQPTRKIETPVGGKESVVHGTKILSTYSNKEYFVDLKTNTIKDSNNNIVEVNDKNKILFDLAWAQDNFGDSTNGSMLVDNKVLLPSGKVLDRNTQKYIEGEEALNVKDIISGRAKEEENKINNSKKVIGEIYENLKRVDKEQTDSDFYYILEDDGLYHKYERVHSRLGSNSIESPKLTQEIDNIRTELSKNTDNIKQYNNYLTALENIYKIKLDAYRGKTDIKSRNAIINIIKDTKLGTESQKAINAGTAVDNIVRLYFTIRDVSKITRPSNITENAFIDLITTLNNIRSNMEARGERFLADNIVLFNKHSDGTRVAGEVDILSVDKNGNFRIYDVKTSKYSFYDFVNKYGQNTNYFENKSSWQRMSQRDYYTLQLSAYKNLFESQYGTPIKTLAIMPFVITYEKSNVTKITNEKGILINYNPAVNVPLTSNVLSVESSITPVSTTQKQEGLPIFESSLELLNPVNDLIPEASFEFSDVTTGYYELDGKIHHGYITPITTIDGINVYMMKIPHITKGFGRISEEAHVASNDFYAVFPNGQTVKILSNDSTDTDTSAKEKIINALKANPSRVKEEASKKTLLFDPNVTPVSTSKKEDVKSTTIETPANILNSKSSVGANITILKEQAIKNHDEEFEDEFTLRKVDETIETSVWNLEKELKWLEKVLPQLSKNDRVKVVKGLIKVGEKGVLAWGLFDKSIITLSDIAAEGTTYHEAFHVVFNLMLSDLERLNLYAEARTLYGDKSNLELEEAMAEGFRKYVMDRDSRTLGRKILDFFKNLLIKTTNWKHITPHLTVYYRMINEGKYANRTDSISSIKDLRSGDNIKYRISPNTQVKPGVSELFESNPELANEVYEAVGLETNITQDDKSYYRGQIEEPTIDKDGNLILYAKEDELYKRAGLKSKGVSMTDDLQSAIEYGNGQLEVAQNLLEEEYGYDVLGYEFEDKIAEIQDNGYYLIQIPKNISNEIVKEAGEVKVIGDKIVIPKGQYKIEQVIDGVNTQITPQQKQQAQQLYAQYLDTKQPDVILPIGTSGSGKSTFVKSLPQENLVVIEPDAMRVEFTGNMNDKSKDKEIYEEAAKRAVEAIKNGKQVVFDTTNLTKDKRLPFIKAIKKEIPNANIQYKLMELNPELAKQRIKAQLERGENRANVPDSTIDRHAASYKQMLVDIKNEPITEYVELGSKQDIEGFKNWVDNRNNFDKELAQKIQNKLQKLYPEIKLNITNNPVWEKGDNIFNQEEYNNQVNYRLKLVEVLLNLSTPQEGKRFRKYREASQPVRLTFRLNTKERPNLETNIRKQLRGKGVTDNQIDFVFDYMKSNNIKEISTEDLITQMLSNYSYTVEINTAKIGAGSKISEVRKQGERYIIVNTYGGVVADFKTEEEAAKYLQKEYDANTQHYSNLTVPGGTNYTENEISTPLITPSITGHAQFATDNGIGWFRSDEQVKDGIDISTGEEFNPFLPDGMPVQKSITTGGILTKTRRILEVQSDLFQKGRDKENLTLGISEETRTFNVNSNNYTLATYTRKGASVFLKNDKEIDSKEFLDAYYMFKEKNKQIIKQNQFLQLLNKDNNWVTFFVKSIIQDSAKKGYEKVLFPTGNTASKIEGHDTLEEFKKEKENRIKELEDFINNPTYDKIQVRSLDSQEQQIKENLESANREINQLKQELERVEREGFGALKPIYNFYENTVTNILKKQYGKEYVNLVTDEYGNTWNEISINQARDLANVLLQRNEANQIIGQANIKAMTVLIDAINQRQDTLPHEYAHHYIAWFRDTPIVQEAIKKWGSEEALVQSIGEQVVKQKGEAYNWWNNFVKWIMNQFNSLSKLQKEELTQILTDAFLTRQDLNNVSNTKSEKDVDNNREANNLNFNTLDSETLKALKDKKWTEEMWNSVSQIEREQAIKCISF